MSTPAIPTPNTQAEKFDGASFIEKQQAKYGPPPTPGQPKPRPAPAEEPKPPVAAAPVVDVEDDEDAPPAPKADETPAQAEARNRREKRANLREELENLKRELAYERGLREGAGKSAPKEVAQPAAGKSELKREDFKTEADYIRAVAKEVTTEEMATSAKDQAVIDEIQSDIEAAKAAFPEHVKLIPEWEKVDEKLKTLHFKGIPDANGVEQYSYFFQLWSRSPYRAFVSEYFAEHPDEFNQLRDQEATRRDVAGMTARFYRLEGKMEAVYNQRHEAAQAAKPEKVTEKVQRTDPENAEQARAAASDDGKETIRLPKPSSEVSARGGSAHANGDVSVKDNPAAWIQRRQEQEKGR